MEGVQWGIRAQADIAERPFAYADYAAGGGLSAILKSIGDFGGGFSDKTGKFEPGPIGQIGAGFLGFLHASDVATGALLNAQDARILNQVRNQPMNSLIPKNTDQGLLGFFGLGGRPMTKAEFLTDLATRGFNIDPDTGLTMSWDEVADRASASIHNFGEAMVSDNAALDMGARMIANPTNLAFIVPVAGQAAFAARVGTMGMRAAGWLGRTTGVARWAQPTATIANASLRTRGFGIGYVADMARVGARAVRLPHAAASANALLQGNVAQGTLRGLGLALRKLTGYKPLPYGRLYGTKAVGGVTSHLGPMMGIEGGVGFGAGARGLATARGMFQAGEQIAPRVGPVHKGFMQTANVLSAYQRGALRVQLGSVGAEFAAGGLDAAVESAFGEESFPDAVSSAIYNLFHDVNNYHPLSDNEAFVMFSAFAFPTVPIALEYPRYVTRAAGHLIGDNDAIVAANYLIPPAELKGFKGRAQATELYRRFGEGNVNLGRQVFQTMLDVVDMREAYKTMSTATRVGFSLDEFGYGNRAITPLVRLRVMQMREAGKFTAKSRMESYWNWLRHGEDGNRSFEFNVDHQHAIQFWINYYKLHQQISPRLAEIGDYIATQMGTFTKEHADQLIDFLEKSAVDGFVPRALHNDIFMRYPALMDNPKVYGQIWARLAQQGDEPQMGGRASFSTLADDRVSVAEVKQAIHDMYDDLPEAREIFHEATAAEEAAQQLAPMPRSLVSVHSTGTLDQIRRDNTGTVKSLSREARALAHQRNAEFTRNGQPKVETVRTFYGYAGTRFERIEGAPGADRFTLENTYLTGGLEGPPILTIRNDRVFTLEYEPSNRGPLKPEEVMERNWNAQYTSEAIVKAVEMGGRATHLDNPPEYMLNVMAAHGFAEIARSKLPDGTARHHLAYRGGSAESLRRVQSYGVHSTFSLLDEESPIPGFSPMAISIGTDLTHIPKRVFLENENIWYMRTSDRVDIKPDTSRPLTDADPLHIQVYFYSGEPRYFLPVEELARIEAGLPNKVPVVLEPWKTGDTPQPIVSAALMPETMMALANPTATFPAGFHMPHMTPAEIFGYKGSMFPEYKASKRIVGPDAGDRMALAAADKASMTVPSMEAIGKEPLAQFDAYHGSGAKFEQFLNEMQGEQPFVGRGFYTTDQGTIAIGYARDTLKDYFENASVYRVEIPKDLPTLDLMGPIPENVKAEFKHILGDPDRIDLFEYGADVANILKGLDAADSGIEFILNWNKSWLAKQRFEIREIMDEVPFEHQMQVSDMLREAAEMAGYRGYTHEGNVFSVDPAQPHLVTVVFDQANISIKERIPLGQTYQSTGARYQNITARMEATRKKAEDIRGFLRDVDRRAEELRTVKLEDVASNHLPPERAQALRDLLDEVHARYPQYDITYQPSFLFDPRDGVIPGLNLERNLARHVLYDYGPLSKISSFYHRLFGPISSKKLSEAARKAMFTQGVAQGVTVKEMESILTALNKRQREQVLGPMRVPWFRDITSLPVNQVNQIAKENMSPAAWAKIEARYGENGFHHLMDDAANQFVRDHDNAIRRGGQKGLLSRALREGYRNWQYAPVAGSTTRIIHKQFYHVFRFMLDFRWHFLNIIEADLLALFTTGRTRFSRKTSDVSGNALLTHTSAEGLPIGVASSIPGSVTGPAHAMELFDAGLYLHNRNLLPVLEDQFDLKRLDSVNSVLDSLPTNDPIIKALVERFGPERRSWSKQLDDMMYAFDTRGVHPTVIAEARKVAREQGWTPEEMQMMSPLLDRIADLNQRSYDDLIGLYTGNLNRTRVERILNSYWLYWPISYQIKATKWLLSWMVNRTGGKQTNMGTAWLINQRYEEFFAQIQNDQNFAAEFEENRELWFVAGMFMPTTPFDTGVSLNKGVRYGASLIAPHIVEPYIGIDGPEDILVRMLEMGPIYTVNLIQEVVNQMKEEEPGGVPTFNPPPPAPLPGLQ